MERTYIDVNKVTDNYATRLLDLTIYTTSSIDKAIDTEISELYSGKKYIITTVSDFFEVYELLKPEINITGSNSFQTFATDIENNYTESVILYSPANYTWKDIELLDEKYSIAITDSSSLLIEKDAWKAEYESITRVDSLLIDGSFENWKTGSLVDWTKDGIVGTIQSPGEEIGRCVRIKKANDSTEAGIISKIMWPSINQKLQLTGRYRTNNEVANGLLKVYDPRSTWEQRFVLSASNEEWIDIENVSFVPEENSEFDNIQMQIKLYPTETGYLGYWTEFDELKITQIYEEVTESLESTANSEATSSEEIVLPGIPIRTSPLHRTLEVEGPLVWEDSLYASNYSVELRLENNLNTQVINEIEETQINLEEFDQVFITNHFKWGRDYYWRIKANNMYGSTDWTSWWKFTTPDMEIEDPGQT